MTGLSDQTAIWGAWRVLESGLAGDQAAYRRHLAELLDQGVSWIDHADIYADGQVEAFHGAALASDPALASKLRIITKCGVRFPSPGQPDSRVAHYRSDAEFIKRCAEASLTRLGVERIDVYLLHRPDYLMDPAGTGAALDDLIREGKIAAAGVSNFPLDRFDALCACMDHALEAHQIEVSPLQSGALDDGGLLDAQMRDLPILAWSPLGGGALFGDGEAALRLRPVLDRIARETGLADAGCAALNWVRRAPGRVIPILGSCRPGRLRDQIAACRAPQMDMQDWYEVLQAGRGERIP